MELSISLVNYNTKNLVKQCVKNIVESHIPFKYEIIITDNNSQDGSVELIEKQILPIFSQTKLVASPKNIGFGAGHNLGLKNSTARYVMILNSDIVVLNNAVEKLHRFISEDRRRGIVGPQLLYADLTLQRSVHSWPSFVTPLYRRTPFGKTFWGLLELKRYDLRGKDLRAPQKVDWMIGACLMIRKRIWDDIKGFDERYFLYYDDVDICKSAWKAGAEVWYFPHAQMIHYHKRHSAKQTWWASIFNKTARIHLQSHFKYFKKWKERTY